MVFIESLEVPLLKLYPGMKPWQTRFKGLVARRKLTQTGQDVHLDQLLFQHREAEASDARDYIWGLASLCAERRQIPSPDYNGMTTRNVFQGVASISILKGDLSILGLCGDPSQPDRPEGLPSWVPDLSHKPGLHMLTGRGEILFSKPERPYARSRFSAGGAGKARVVLGSGGLLRVPGMLVGEIEEVAAGSALVGSTQTKSTGGVTTVSSSLAALVPLYRELIRQNFHLQHKSPAWKRVASRAILRRRVYAPTWESVEDALLRTYLEGEDGEILERMRPAYRVDQLGLNIWWAVTLGQGCSCLPLAIAIIIILGLALVVAAPLLRLLGYTWPWSMAEYVERVQITAERELFRSKENLIGLAP